MRVKIIAVITTMVALAFLYVFFIKEIAKTNWLVDMGYMLLGGSLWVYLLYTVYQDAQMRLKKSKNE
jgi:hypothetical protein